MLPSVLNCRASQMAVPLGLLALFSVVGRFVIGADQQALQAQERAIVVEGEPYGIGRIEFQKSRALEIGWYSDQAIELKCSQCKILFPTVSERRAPVAGGEEPSLLPAEGESRLRIHFLYSGSFPSVIEVAIGGEAMFQASADRGDSHVPYHTLLKEWWASLCEQSQRDLSPSLNHASEDLLAAVGLRLGLSPKMLVASRPRGANRLEEQFERTVGMLLGFESIRLAMMVDESTADVGSSPAAYSLPNPVNIARLRLPASAWNASKEIEPIASMVPHDCFYVRCRAVRNLVWLRQVLIDWGGSLDEIIANSCLNADIRERLESQLGISAQQFLDKDIESDISDLAIIGTDVFFAEGAGVGVLLQAKAGRERELEAKILEQRLEARARSGAVQHSEILHGHSVSFMRTSDHRMRSLAVRVGGYVLVTNSQQLMHAVLKLTSSSGSLASLDEYRFANGANPKSQTSPIKFYLSDPFFRRITSPAFRIELSRRRAASRDCQRLEIAALVSKSFGRIASSRQSLVEDRFLPADFGLRPDGSHVELVGEEAIDSLRGRVGTFLPVADMHVRHANGEELRAFDRFAQRYRQEWPTMDPVLASLDRRAVAGGTERIDLQIHVMPYARKEYGFLTAYLAEPTVSHAAFAGRELCGVSAHLQSHSQRFLAHLGLCDTEIPFRVQQGELHREGIYASTTLVQQRSFAAVTPAGREGLEVLAGLMSSLQKGKMRAEPLVRPSSPAQLSSKLNLFQLLQGISSPAHLAIEASDAALRGVFDLARLNAITEDTKWSIYGAVSKLRHEVRAQLVERQLAQPTQIHLRARGD